MTACCWWLSDDCRRLRARFEILEEFRFVAAPSWFLWRDEVNDLSLHVYFYSHSNIQKTKIEVQLWNWAFGNLAHAFAWYEQQSTLWEDTGKKSFLLFLCAARWNRNRFAPVAYLRSHAQRAWESAHLHPRLTLENMVRIILICDELICWVFKVSLELPNRSHKSFIQFLNTSQSITIKVIPSSILLLPLKVVIYIY